MICGFETLILDLYSWVRIENQVGKQMVMLLHNILGERMALKDGMGN